VAVTTWAPGSCGELVQGILDGLEFSITCPIARYSRVRLHKQGKKVVVPQENTKLREAIQRGLISLGISSPPGLVTEVQSSLPQRKGLNSSTADLSAGLMALGQAFGYSFTPAEIAQIALQVEPTHGLMFPGITLFDHRCGGQCQNLGEPPAMELLVFDYGGESPNPDDQSDLRELNEAKEGIIRVAVALVREGLQEGRPELIARGATMSALANQKINYKEGLEELAQLATSQLGALGICIAHSGTVVGLIYDKIDEYSREYVVEKVKTSFPLTYLFHSQVISGGVNFQDPLQVGRAGA
jgi:L-threonine kinase